MSLLAADGTTRVAAVVTIDFFKALFSSPPEIPGSLRHFDGWKKTARTPLDQTKHD